MRKVYELDVILLIDVLTTSIAAAFVRFWLQIYPDTIRERHQTSKRSRKFYLFLHSKGRISSLCYKRHFLI